MGRATHRETPTLIASLEIAVLLTAVCGCLLFVACTHTTTAAPDPIQIIDTPHTTAPPATLPLLHRQFEAVVSREAGAVLSPSATPSSVEAITAADRAARAALQPLERAGRPPTRAELDKAHAAVGRLREAVRRPGAVGVEP